MVSTKSVGDRHEKQANEILKKLGYITQIAQRTMKPYFAGGHIRYCSQANDFFGLYDIIAKKGTQTLWVQVKTNVNHTYGIKDALKDFYMNYCSKTEEVQIWLKVKFKGFVIFTYSEELGIWSKRYINLKGKSTSAFIYSQQK